MPPIKAFRDHNQHQEGIRRINSEEGREKNTRAAKMNPTIMTILMFSILVILCSSILATTTAASRANPESMDMGFPGYSGGDDIPDFGKGSGGGYGGGYSSPSGGKHWSGIHRESKVCKNKGHCHKKKLRCPAKCYRAWSKSGKHYGGGGGGGGCVLDCKRCASYC